MLSRGSTQGSLAIPELPEEQKGEDETDYEPGAVIPMDEIGRSESSQPLSPRSGTTHAEIESRETDV